MKVIKRFLLLVFCALPMMAGAAAPVATTAGDNLTAWNGNMGALSNNSWNSMMNSRASGGGNIPKADYENCNSLILRCAQPKCSGCTDMSVARPIVEGCVNASAVCKKYAEQGLVEYITAQIVSNASAKMQEQQLAAQQAAAAQAAAQNNSQIQQMQQQMSQMQQQMQQQSAQQMAQMQAALEEQKALAAAAQQEALNAQQARHEAQMTSATLSGGEMTAAQEAAIKSGASADLVARNTISGEIMTHIKDAETGMSGLKTKMEDVFKYAGCDSRGSNCSGPKRVRKFKEIAQPFFDEYNKIVDELYEALELSLVVGVDISDVIMMLNNSCNKWGKYMCRKNSDEPSYIVYDKDTCPSGKSVSNSDGICDKDGKCYGGLVRGGQSCRIGMTVPPQDDVRCSLLKILDKEGTDENIVQREWLIENDTGDGVERVGCATSALDTIEIFGRRRSSKGDSSVTLDVLERILAQDASEIASVNRYTGRVESDDKKQKTQVCAMTEKGYRTLQNAISTRTVPSTICVSEKDVERNFTQYGLLSAGVFDAEGLKSGIFSGISDRDACARVANVSGFLSECDVKWKGGRCIFNQCACKCEGLKCEELGDKDKPQNCKSYSAQLDDKEKKCKESNGTWNTENGTCTCGEGANVKEDECVCAEDEYEIKKAGGNCEKK